MKSMKTLGIFKSRKTRRVFRFSAVCGAACLIGLVVFALAADGPPAAPVAPGAAPARQNPPSTAEGIRYSGAAAELSLARVSDRTFEIQLAPIGPDGTPDSTPFSETLVDYPRETLWSGRSLDGPLRLKVGGLVVELQPSPLSIVVLREDGSTVQRLSWPGNDGRLEFLIENPVFGLGHGGPQFDRRGHLLPMKDGWGAYERPTHGSRVSTPMLIGADGWSMFVHHPISAANVFDLLGERGVFLPDAESAPRFLRLFLTAWDDPREIFSEYRTIAGATPLPPRWALGYMQSHRTLDQPEQMLKVAREFRDRRLPADAVIYLGTGFTPSGWNKGHGSFEFNREIFDDPERIIADLKALDFRVVLHTYSPPVGLHGSSVEEQSENPKHIRNYWKDLHEPVFKLGVDGWWPDGGEPLSPESRLARYRLYWQGPLHSRPNVRPWNINRTGYSGVHRYGGWIWSGDPDSYWETLKTQIAVGLNHVVSLTPFWGSDTGGFLPSVELTGELYIRWLQFSTFTASFRGHGRAWHLRLPWGWNTGRLGPAEVDAYSSAFKDGYPNPEELRNGLIEPIAREYLQLRYRLLTYNSGLTRETHDTGLPPMRAMWIHSPHDPKAVALGDQYMWGPALLVAPVYTKGAIERRVYLPEGLWHDFWTNEAVEGGREIDRRVDLATLPLYVPAGTILPLDPVRQHTGEHTDDPITFRIYPGRDGEYLWYRDDGESMDYLKGAYSRTRIRWKDDTGEIVIEPDPQGGGHRPEPAVIRFVLMPGGAAETVEWDGASGRVLPLIIQPGFKRTG